MKFEYDIEYESGTWYEVDIKQLYSSSMHKHKLNSEIVSHLSDFFCFQSMCSISRH